MDQDVNWYGGRPRPRRLCVRWDGDPAPSPQKGCGALQISCLSCVSVTLVYCGQTVERIKMKLGMQVGLGPGHIVLSGDLAPPPQRGTPPIFGPYLLRPNGCMDQDVT